MKRSLLYSLLISCSLLFGVTRAHAAYTMTVTSVTGTAGANGLSGTPIATTATNYSVYGFTLVGSGGGGAASTITALTFANIGTSYTTYGYGNNTFYTTAYLYVSPGGANYTPGTTNVAANLIATATSDGTQNITFTPGTPIAISGTTNNTYYIVFSNSKVTAAAGAGTYQLQYTGATSAKTVNSGTSVTGPVYTYAGPVSLGTASTTGLAAAGSLNSSTQTQQGIFGFSVTTTATTTITGMTFTPTVSAGNMGTYFTNVQLFVNTTNSFATATAVPAGYMVSALTGATVTITGLTQAVNTTTLYYFIKADYIPPTSGNPTFQLNATSVTTSTPTTVTTGGPIAGTVYTLYNGVTTLAALGVTSGPTNSLDPNPLVSPVSGAIYGFSLSNSGTATSPSITALTFTSTAPQFNSYYFTNYTLYSSSSSTFSGGTQVGTVQPAGGNNTLSFTGLNITVPAGGTVYYYVSATYKGVAANSTYQLNFSTATTASGTTSVAANASNTGFNYTCNAQTYTIATNTAGIQTAATPYYLGSTGDVLESFGVTSNSTGTLNSFTLTTAAAYTTYFSNFSIYTSTNPNYANDLAGTGSPLVPVAYTTAGTTTQTVTLTGGQAISSTPLYFFVVADFTNGAASFTNTTTSVTYQYSLSAASVTPASGTMTASNTFPIAYNAYKLLSPVALSAYTGGGLAAAGSLNSATQTQQAILGFDVTTAQNETITSMTFTPTVSAGNMGTYFSNVTLYVSTTNSVGSATAVPAGYTVSALTGSTVTITGLSQAVNTTTLYYFIKADYNPPTSGNPTFQLSATNVGTSTPYVFTYPCGGPINGTVYTLYNGVTTLTALGSTNPTASGLDANPLMSATVGAIYGCSIANSGTVAAPAITALAFTSTAPQVNSYYFSNYTLYSSPTSTFNAGTATQVGTTQTAGANNALSFTGLNISVPAGGTLYYFVSASYKGVAASSTYQLNFSTATTSTGTTSVAAGATNTGFNYTCSPLTYTIGNNTTGIQSAATPYYLGSTGDVLESFGISSTTPATLNSFTLTSAVAYTTYFSNLTVYTSTNPNYAADLAGTGAPLTSVPFTTTGATTLAITLTGGQPIVAPQYYFVVADFTNGAAAFTSTATSINFQFSMSTASVTPASGTITATNTYPISYTTYKLQCPTALGAATTTGLAAAGSLNSPTQTQQGILGFSVTSTQNETISAITLTPTVSAGNMSNYFSNVTLYVSTSNSFAAATAVPAGYSVSALSGSTITISGLSQAINTTTLYYFIKADYTPPTSGNPTFQLSASNVTTSAPATFTYTCGAPINGTVYTLYNGVTTLTSIGSTGTGAPNYGLMANPLINVQTGAVYGFSLANSGTDNSPTITALTFASVDPQNNNQYYFDSFTLYSSTSSTYSSATATQVGTTFTTGANNNPVTFTGLSITIPASGTLYYFVVGNYNGVPAASTYQMNFTSATTALSTTSVAAGATNTGFNYTCSPLTYTITTNTTGIQTAATPYYFGSTGDVLESFGVTSTGNSTLTSFTLKPYIAGANAAYTTYFTNFTVYSSTNPNYAADLAGTGSPLTAVPVTTSGTTTLLVTFNTAQNLSPTAIYYFVVSDFTLGDNLFTNTTTATTFQYRLTTAAGSATLTNTATIPYTTYNLLSPVALGAATTTGLATTNQLSYDQTQVGILGFAVTTVQNETITTMNFTAAISSTHSTIGTFFSNVNLYVSTTNNFAAATLVSGATVSSLSSTSLTFSISGLSQVINNTTLYYFIKADYTAPTNFSSTFQLSATNVIDSNPITYTCGAPINGTVYNCSPAVLLGTATTTGLATNPVTTSATGIGIFGFSLFSGPGYTFTTFNLSSVQPSGQYLNTNFANYTLYVNTTNSFTGATQVTGATFSNIANSNTLTISGLSQAIPAGTTYYYFIKADYTSPAIATTYELNLNSVATATTTYTTGGPIYGTNYTLTGKAGVYYWEGGTNSTWENGNNWLSAYTNSTNNGYPGQTLLTDLAVFSPVYETNYLANITASKTIGQILVLANNTSIFAVEIKNGLTCTITNGVTLGDAGQLNQTNTYFSQLALYETNNNGTGVFNIGGISSLYNDGSIAVAANVVFSSGAQINLYGTTADPAYVGTFATGAGFVSSNGAISGSNVTYNCNGPGSELYGGAGTFAATSSILNFAGFSSQMSAFGAAMTLTGCTVNAISTSNNQYVNGLGISSGSITATSSTVINLGTSGANGAFTTIKANGGTFNLTGNSTINMLGASSFISNAYYAPVNNIAPATPTMNITGSTINMGSSGGADGSSSEIFNSSVFNFNAASILNINGANTELLNTSSTYGGTTYSGIFIANATSVINPTSTTAVIYNTLASNYFTLLSTSAASATIGTLGSGAKIVGQYNVQRYLNGGQGYLRNYRMLSSPVNMTGYVSNAANLIDLSYIGATATIPTATPTTYYGAFIGGPDPSFGGGVHTFVNPLMYLYQENIAPGAPYKSTFTAGKNVGVVSLNAAANTVGTKNTALGEGSMSPPSAAPSVPSTPTGLSGFDNGTGVAVPPGNGYITYYVGNSQDAAPSTLNIPTASNVTASGYINQGQVQLFLWGSVSPYLTDTYGIPNIRLPGITVVGNPYPSTIDLQKVWADNSGAITPSLYQLDATTQQFDTYNTSTQMSSTSVSAEYIGSGLGFYVHTDSLGSTKQFYFQEDQKTPSATGGVYPPLSNFALIPPKEQLADNVNVGKITDGINPGGSTADAAALPSGTMVTNKLVAIADGFVERKQPAIPVSNVKPEVPQVKHAPPTNPVTKPAMLHLKFVVDSVDNDEVALAFNSAWSDKFDRNDSFDMDGQSGKAYLSSYTSDDIRTSVNALGSYTGGKRVKLFVKASTAGIFQVQMTDIKNFDTNDYSVFLLDKMLNDSLDLTLYKSYNFNYGPGTANDSTRFVLAIEHKPVPYYALLTFAGQKVTQGVQLNWTLKNEFNNTKFVLQKLGTNNTYYFLDSLRSDSSSVYDFVDQHPTMGDNTYRLQQTNALGVITYSAPVTIGYNSTAPNGGLNIYPNPSRDVITVTLTTTSIAAQVATVDIYNTSGTLIDHKVVNSNSFKHEISSYQLGVYIIELKNSNGELVGKSKFVKVQ